MNWREWCRHHKIPYIHGCIWDRYCQEWAPIPRISVLWGNHMWWVDLPGYWRRIVINHEAETFTYRRGWCRIGFGHTRSSLP